MLYFKMVSFALPLPEEAHRDFSQVLNVGICSKSWREISRKWGECPPMTGSHGVFNCQTHSHWVSSNVSIAVQVFLLILVPATISAPKCLAQWAMGLAVCTVSTVFLGMDPRKLVDFSVCSTFYLLLGWSDFQDSYMWNWKLLSYLWVFMRHSS